MPLILQMFISTLVITGAELLIGVIVNVWLGWNVWNYSQMPFNFLGQICLLFSVGWFFLSPLAIFIEDYWQYLFNKGKKPYYYVFRWGKPKEKWKLFRL
jgi:Predicted membrane protein